MPKEPKYLAVKPAGLDFFVWFERKKVTEEYGTFEGREGWGKDGAFTHLTCPTVAIESRIKSDTLQY